MVTADQQAREELEMGGAAVRKPRDHVPVYIPTFEEGLLDEAPREKRFLDFLRARPSRDWFLKFGLSGRFSSISLLRRNSSTVQRGDEHPPQEPTSTASWHRRFRVSFVRKVNWDALVKYAKDWLRNPANMAFLIWLAAVTAVLLIMLLVVSGMLNGALPRSSQRKQWVEVTSQILNALFAIICVYQHPKLAHHLVQVFRWGSKDVAELRQVYSKNGAARPHERFHIGFVVALLHLTCFMQYAICGLYWGYKKSDRPELPVNLCMVVGIAAPIIAGVYTLYGPLARKVDPDSEEESQRRASALEEEKRRAAKGHPRRVVVSKPQWVGGLFDCWNDMTVAYLSFFCTFCVFGWNMERLGFGNMYVHIFTFILFIVAPFWIFNVAGLSIDDSGVREFVGIVGILLCFLGLLYGGFWRIQMRKKFKLPSNKFCWGYPNLTDCMQWLFCWSCSLAQEVRTGNFYDVEDGSFYSKQYSSSPSDDDEGEGSSRLAGLHPLPREDGAGPVEVMPPFEVHIAIALDQSAASPAEVAESHSGSPRVESNNVVMAAPVPPLIQTEAKSINQTAEI
ncbi:hypothetical protein Taro_022608 [Colocasia esculenta]|uniref:Uncharacterized protein n=1 Tax=Colocasia esculenta TaxID=4460 RepID=A0A843V2C8_COLES|nr:hypothetical protein [Colocasia esculenta]